MNTTGTGHEKQTREMPTWLWVLYAGTGVLGLLTVLGFVIVTKLF
ncbi:hypothetical protein [Luteibacter sp.]|jgi:hypothetical protein